MADLRCYLTTYNCGRSLVHVDYFASSLFSKLQQGQLPPDLIVLSLQEIAPIAYSFIGGSFLSPYFTRIQESVTRATSWKFGKDVKYGTIVTRNVGMTGIMVFAEQSIVGKIRWIDEAGTGVGLFDMGNKGAVGVRLALGLESSNDEMVVTFVAAHLAPMENACAKRNEDWRRICENLVFEPNDAGIESQGNSSESQPLLSKTPRKRQSDSDGPEGMFSTGSHLFFAGDLNYRTSNHPPDMKDFESWPQPMASEADPTHYRKLFSSDQLNRERKQGNTLHLLDESPVNFPPTYKYSSRAQKLVADQEKAHGEASSGGRTDTFTGFSLDSTTEQVWLWAKHRVPSWCDRILYLSSSPPVVHSYTALAVQPTSDHRPVALSFSIPWKSLDAAAAAKPPFPISDGWKQRRAVARRNEVIVGLASYLALTTTGQMILATTAVGAVLIYYLVSSNIW